MSPLLNRFPSSLAALALALVALAGLGGAAYGLVKVTAGASRDAPAGAVGGIVGPPRPGMVALRVVNSHLSVPAGGTVTYRVRIIRACSPVRLCGRLHRYQAARAWLRALGPRPTGLIETFIPPVTRSSFASLVVRTRTSARPGSYRLRLGAWIPQLRGSGYSASTAVTLTIARAPGPALRIAGSPSSVLAPGRVAGIDLALTNLQRARIAVTRVVVSVRQVSAPRADAAHPCSPADFAVSQLPGSYRLALAPLSTRTLQQLGIAQGRWPTLAMLDRPVNQDGCQGATVSLAYAATATG